MVTNGCNGFPVPRVREHFVRPSIYIGHPTGYEKNETSNEKPPPDRDEHQHFYALTTWKPICDVFFCPYGLGHKKMTIRLFTAFCQQFVEKIRVAYGQIRPPASKK